MDKSDLLRSEKRARDRSSKGSRIEMKHSCREEMQKWRKCSLEYV